jgi:hypothetical protein
MNCPWDHQPQQNHTAGSLCTSNLSALTEMQWPCEPFVAIGECLWHKHPYSFMFYGLWEKWSAVQPISNTALCIGMPCQMCIFSQRSGSGDLLGWRLGNHSLPTSLPSNTNWCFCCSPYPCWIPAMHCGLGFGNIPKHTVWKGSGYIYTCMECAPSVKPWLARSVPCKLTYATAEYAT